MGSTLYGITMPEKTDGTRARHSEHTDALFSDCPLVIVNHGPEAGLQLERGLSAYPFPQHDRLLTPRVSGEHVGMTRAQRVEAGSPPRARGARFPLVRPMVLAGITPA